MSVREFTRDPYKYRGTRGPNKTVRYKVYRIRSTRLLSTKDGDSKTTLDKRANFRGREDTSRDERGQVNHKVGTQEKPTETNVIGK